MINIDTLYTFVHAKLLEDCNLNHMAKVTKPVRAYQHLYFILIISGQGIGGFLLQVQFESHDRGHADRGLWQTRRRHHEGVHCQGIFSLI